MTTPAAPAAPTAAAASADISAIAGEILATLSTGRQVAPFTARPAGLTSTTPIGSSAALNGMRQARGEKPVGRKIGFTNRTIWAEYGVCAPIWGYVYDTTVRDLGDTAALAARRLRRAAHRAGDRVPPRRRAVRRHGRAALLACIDWVAHGFEIVQSIFPRLEVRRRRHRRRLRPARRAADRAAPSGRRARRRLAGRARELRDRPFLRRPHIDRGHAANVLDGPLGRAPPSGRAARATTRSIRRSPPARSSRPERSRAPCRSSPARPGAPRSTASRSTESGCGLRKAA